jgi:signal peptidase
MEPAFQRGDLLFLWNRAPRAEIGEIVVYNVVGYICLDCGLFGANVCLFFFFCLQRGKDIPIVHRVSRTFPEVEGKNNKVKEIAVYVYS